jgi:multisubunit Na+/H+ antiporter MnhF subunit
VDATGGLVLSLTIAGCTVWVAFLAAVLAAAAARHGSVMARILWIDTLTFVLIALLTLVGYGRGQPEYLDVALLLALLAFAGTMAATQYHRRGRLL